MNILSTVGPIKGITKLAVLGVADKMLKISAFFVPLHLLLAFFDSNQHANFKLDSNNSLTLVYIFTVVAVLFSLRWTAHAIRTSTDLKLKTQATLRLNELGLLKHTKTPNSSSNAIISYLESRSVFIFYCFIGSIFSFFITSEASLTLIPLATLIVGLWITGVFKHKRYGFYFYAGILNAALFSFMYAALLYYSENTNHEQLLLLLLFVIFIFRFGIDSAVTYFKKTEQIDTLGN